MKPSEKSESEEYMMGDAYRVAKQAYDKKDKTMTTRDAGLTQEEQVEAAEVHAAGSSHCGEIKSKSAFSRYSTFTIHCGVPQGCPFSPLAFLIIAEGLTWLIEDCPDVEGIEINGAVIKISQFADDSQIIVRTYESIQRVRPMLEKYEKATNMRGNKSKFVGIQCGTLKDQPIPPNIPPQIKWLKQKEHTNILGVPFWVHDPEEEWWDEKYLQIKTKMANWHSLTGLTLHGRVLLANSMIYSIPRYWTQSSKPPDRIIECLEADVYHLLWAKTMKLKPKQ
jgi:hypothetical protein